MKPNDLYSLLAVPSDASENDIRNSFMSLVLCLHPDKQPNRPHDEEKNEPTVNTSDLFNEIERAYRILSNPITRRAYDAYGMTGVDVIGGPESGMSIVPRHRICSIEDVVAALLRERRRSALETDVACNAHVLAECDLWEMSFRQIIMQQAVVMEPSPRCSLKAGAFVASSGSSGVTVDARFRPWKENQYIATSWVVAKNRIPEVMVRSGGLLWDGKTNGEAAIVLKKGEIPSLRLSSSRNLWRGVQGQTSCTLGKGASLLLATQHGWTTELVAGPSLRLVVSYKPAAVTVLPALASPPVQRSWDAKLKIGGAVLIEVSANRTIRFGRSKMRVGFCWGFGGDLSAVIRLSRGSMRVHIPIRVGRFRDPIGVLLSLVIPQALDSFVSWGVSQFGFNHYDVHKTNQWCMDDDDDHGKPCRKTLEEAESQCRLMSRVAARKAQMGRLVVRLATYCDSQDVTIPLQFFVDQSSASLNLPKGSKTGLLGFCRPPDIPENFPALLFIRYELGGRMFEITTEDEASVCLPSPDAVYVGLSSTRL